MSNLRETLIEAEKALCAAQYVDNKEIRQMGFDAARDGIMSALTQLAEPERDPETMDCRCPKCGDAHQKQEEAGA